MEEIVFPLPKIWNVRLATHRYGDVFEHYYKVGDSLDEMKQEIEGIVEKIEKEEEEDEKEMRIENHDQMKKREEARKKEKEKIASFLEEFTNVLNIFNTLHIHLSSISGSLEELAHTVDPNHDIEF